MTAIYSNFLLYTAPVGSVSTGNMVGMSKHRRVLVGRRVRSHVARSIVARN